MASTKQRLDKLEKINGNEQNFPTIFVVYVSPEPHPPILGFKCQGSTFMLNEGEHPDERIKLIKETVQVDSIVVTIEPIYSIS